MIFVIHIWISVLIIYISSIFHIPDNREIQFSDVLGENSKRPDFGTFFFASLTNVKIKVQICECSLHSAKAVEEFAARSDFTHSMQIDLRRPTRRCTLNVSNGQLLWIEGEKLQLLRVLRIQLFWIVNTGPYYSAVDCQASAVSSGFCRFFSLLSVQWTCSGKQMRLLQLKMLSLNFRPTKVISDENAKQTCRGALVTRLSDIIIQLWSSDISERIDNFGQFWTILTILPKLCHFLSNSTKLSTDSKTAMLSNFYTIIHVNNTAQLFHQEI